MGTTRGALMVAVAGLLIALLAAAGGGWSNGGVWLGVGIALLGFVAWQVAARRDSR